MNKLEKLIFGILVGGLLFGCSIPSVLYKDSCNSLNRHSYHEKGGLERFTVRNGDTRCDADDKYGAERIMERAEKQSGYLVAKGSWIFTSKIKFIQLGNTRNIFNQIHAGGYKVVPPFWIGAEPSKQFPGKIDISDMRRAGQNFGVFEYGKEHDLRIVYNFQPNNILNVVIFVDGEQVYVLKDHKYDGAQVFHKYGIYRFHYSYQTIDLDDSVVEFKNAKMTKSD